MWHRRIKSLHGWLGLLIWPWLVMIALTGLYQNHQSALDPWLPSAAVTPQVLAALPSAPVTTPDLTNPAPVTLFGRPAWAEKDGSRGVDAATGATWEVGTFLTTWTDAQGSSIGWRMDWQKLFLRLHRAGWAGDQLGTWPADLAALALLLFGLSGIWLFAAHRLRRK